MSKFLHFLLVISITFSFLLASSCSVLPRPQEKPGLSSTPTAVTTNTIVEQLELRHDNNKVRTTISCSGGHIVSFIAPSSFKITKIPVFGVLNEKTENPESRKFILEIWDINKNTLYSKDYSYTIFPKAKPGWIEIEIPDVVINGKFFVHLYTNSPGSGLHIGADDSVINEYSDVTMRTKNNSVVVSPIWPWQPDKWWFSDKEKVNWMIRAVGIAEITSKPATIKNSPVTKYAVDKGLSDLLSKLKYLDADDIMSSSEKALLDLLASHLTQVKKAFPNLYEEILKLPDLRVVDEVDVVAISRILKAAINPEYKSSFVSILAEGIPSIRKYCTPLEALLWIAFDGEVDNYYPLQNYPNSKTDLIIDAWRNAKISQSYKSDTWKDFSTVVERLNTPYLANFWALENLIFDNARSKYVGDPETTFKLKRGVCRHLGMFVTECLTRAGYDAKNFTILYGKELGKHDGHSVTVFKLENNLWIAEDSTRPGKIVGPFDGNDKVTQDIMTNGVKRANENILKTFVEDNKKIMERNAWAFQVFEP